MQLCKAILEEVSSCWTLLGLEHMGLKVRNPVFGGLRATKVQTACTVRTAPLLFTFWKVSYLNLLPAKVQFSN